MAAPVVDCIFMVLADIGGIPAAFLAAFCCCSFFSSPATRCEVLPDDDDDGAGFRLAMAAKSFPLDFPPNPPPVGVEIGFDMFCCCCCGCCDAVDGAVGSGCGCEFFICAKSLPFDLPAFTLTPALKLALAALASVSLVEVELFTLLVCWSAPVLSCCCCCFCFPRRRCCIKAKDLPPFPPSMI